VTRIYPEVVGVQQYCRAIDADPHHSPFVPIAKLLQPAILHVARPATRTDLEEDGFFLVDALGKLLSTTAARAAYVIAPHVAQRQRGGRFREHFDRKRGETCGFGGASARRLQRDQAVSAIEKAWIAWGHGAEP
jgi:hypothetical protein